MVESNETAGVPIGAQLHFRKYGEGPALVVLHGFLGAGGNWHTLASKAFAPHFTTYAIDQRNHGRSPHAPEMSYEVLANDLLDFLNAHAVDRAHVLGHSLGGKVAMEFALRYPDRTNRLVVADIAPKLYPPKHLTILEALQASSPERATSRADVDRELATRIPELGVRQFLLKNLSYDSDTKQYAWEMNLPVLATQYNRLNEGIEGGRTFAGETLFVRGSRSNYISPGDEALIRSMFTSARMETIEGAGHWVHADAPEEFARVVLAFLLG